MEEKHITINDVRAINQEHTNMCPTPSALKDLQKEVQELWKKVILIEVLDHRVTAVEDSLATIEANIATTMTDIHKIQTSIAESNVVHLWAGRIVIGITSAAVTFLVSKYS